MSTKAQLELLALLTLLWFALSSAEAQKTGPSADETVSYINKTLHKYPTVEFVASGCPGYQQTLTVARDRRSLIVEQLDYGCHSKTVTVPVFSLQRKELGKWSKSGQHSSFYLTCDGFQVRCFMVRGGKSPEEYERWDFQATSPDEVSDRLTNAIAHLVDALLDEAKGNLDDNDPFAKKLN